MIPQAAPREDRGGAPVVGDGIGWRWASPRDATRERGAALSGAAAVLAVVVLLAPLYGTGLGSAPIVGDDEAREVGIIQDIAERGRWLLPRFNGAVLPDKPPLYHWLAAAACVARGRCDETIVRLPSVVAALALVAVVGLAARRMFSDAAGVAAALLLGLSPALYDRARSAKPDVLMILFLTVALVVFHDWWRSRPARRRHGVIMGVALGLAALAKGPVAPALAAITGVVFLARRGDLGRVRALARADFLLPVGLLGGAWYAVALAGWGTRFAGEHLLGRYLGNLVGGGLAFGVNPDYTALYHIGFYPVHLLLATLPWTPLLVAALVVAWRDPDRRRDPRLELAQVWMAAVVLVFGLAAFKARHYVLPALPPAALLAAPVAASLTRRPAGGPGRSDAGLGPAVVTGLAGLAAAAIVAGLLLAPSLPGALSAVLSRSDLELVRAAREIARGRPASAAGIATALAVLTAAALAAARARRWRLGLTLAAAATFVWMAAVQPALHGAVARTASVDSFAGEIDRLVPRAAPLYFHRRVLRPLVVYLRRPVASLGGDLTRLPPGPAFVIGLRTDVPELRAGGARVRVLARGSGRIGNLERGRIVLVALDGRPPHGRERPAESASARR
jgi:4-amino-4-deoxy-L-arabinose transferase-like glycosyltransferase